MPQSFWKSSLKKNVLIIAVVILLFAGFAKAPHSVKKSLNDYEMWEILEDPKLTEDYKTSHKYLDEMFYWTVDQPGRVLGIGYSPIWDVLKVNLVEENTGEDTLIYSEAEEWLVNSFMLSEDPDHFFSTFIEGYLPRLWITGAL